MTMQSKNVEISVLVPVYKVESYLQRCIDSVLSQDFTDYELILVDDGSPDKCPEICDINAEMHPDVIKVVHKENGGLISARKYGVQAAKGRYYIFLDSDDTLRPRALVTLYNHIVKGYDMVRAGGVRKSNEGEEFPLELYSFEEGEIVGDGEFIKALYMGKVAPYLWGAIYTSSLFNDEVYNETMKQRINVGEDWVTNMIIARNIHRSLYIKDKVYNYYVNSESYMSTSVMSNEYLDRIDVVLTKYNVYDDNVLDDYAPVKRCLDILGTFFAPELPFSVEKYKYVKSVMTSSKWRKMIRERTYPNRLRFVDNYILYRIYSFLYKILFKYIKQHGYLRKVIY